MIHYTGALWGIVTQGYWNCTLGTLFSEKNLEVPIKKSLILWLLNFMATIFAIYVARA